MDWPTMKLEVVTFTSILLWNFSCIYSNEIDLHQQLSSFQRCTVHLIFNELINSMGTGEIRTKIRPWFPVVKSVHFYEPSSTSAGYTCGKQSKWFTPVLKNQTKSWRIPIPKQNCIATFYIAPLQCGDWKADSFHEYLQIAHHLLDFVLYFARPSIPSNKVYPHPTPVIKDAWNVIQVQSEHKYSIGSKSNDNFFYFIDLISQKLSFLTTPSKLKIHIVPRFSGRGLIFVASKIFVVSKAPAYRKLSNILRSQTRRNIKLALISHQYYTYERIHTFLFASILYNMETRLDSLPLALTCIDETQDQFGRFSGHSSSFSVEKVILSGIFPNYTVVSRSPCAYDHFTTGGDTPSIEGLDHSVSMYDVFDEPENTKIVYLTCFTNGIRKTYSYQESLEALVSPFQCAVWFCLVTTAVLTGVFYNWVLLVQKYFFPKSGCNVIYKGRHDRLLNLMFVYNILIGEGIKNARRCKWLCGAWLLAGVVFSDSWKGDNIMKLIAQAELVIDDTFSTLLRYNIPILSPISAEVNTKFDLAIRQSIMFEDINIMEMGYDYRDIFQNLIRRPTSFEEFQKYTIPNFYLREMTNCSNLAYVDTMENTLNMFLALKNKMDINNPKRIGRYEDSENLRVSRPYSRSLESWIFTGFPVNAHKLLSKIRTFMQSSGIYSYSQRAKLDRIRHKVNQESRFEYYINIRAASMTGNIRVIFLSYLVALGLSSLNFSILEISYSVYIKYLRMVADKIKYIILRIFFFAIKLCSKRSAKVIIY